MIDGRPTKPSDIKTAKFLRFVDPDDPEELIELEVIDTGNVTVDGKRIMQLGVAASVVVPPPSPPSAINSGSFVLPDTSANPIGTGGLDAGVTVKADSDNTDDVWVGDSTVAIDDGMRLEPGESLFIPIDALGKVHAIGSSGDTVHYIGG